MYGEGMSILSRALLGLIAAEPTSGYSLARLFERTVGRAWRAQHSEIYPTLAMLEDAELIRVVDHGARQRKTYTVTGAGVDEVQRWLRETSPDRPVRNEAILRVFLLWLLEADEAIAFFTEEIATHRQRLEGFEQTLADDEHQRQEHGTADGGIQFTSSLALEWALRYEREYIAWATWAQDQIAEHRPGWNRVRNRRLSTLRKTGSHA